MMETTDCTPVDCSTCNEECGSRQETESNILKPHPWSNIKKVIAIGGGKGGVGRSYITSNLAVSLKNEGYNVGILDADIMGPAISHAFGIKEKASGSDKGIYPVKTSEGIEIFSMGLLQKSGGDPAILNAATAAGIVKQFWTEVIWGDKDFLLIDLPSGTGDIPQTVLEVLPVNAVVCVTNPFALTQIITEKSVRMIETAGIPVLAVVVNKSSEETDDIKNTKADASIPYFATNEYLMNRGLTSEISLKELKSVVDKIIHLL